MKTWWAVSPKPGNIGDILLPWMMRKDGVEPEYVGSNYQGKIIGIGSTLKFVQKEDEVWTTGAMRRTDQPSPKASFRALRGPITAEICGMKGKVPLGDGAMCLPRYFQPVKKPLLFRDSFGVVPHYIDLPHRGEWPFSWADAKVISPLTTDVEAFVSAVANCDRIESSSLHGCIIAAAYGIPWKWVRISNRLSGDDTKFEDFRLSLPQINIDDLMAARPWIQ